MGETTLFQSRDGGTSDAGSVSADAATGSYGLIISTPSGQDIDVELEHLLLVLSLVETVLLLYMFSQEVRN